MWKTWWGMRALASLPVGLVSSFPFLSSHALPHHGLSSLRTWLCVEATNASFIFFDIFIDYAITVVPFLPLHSTPPCPPPPSHIPLYSPCPWVILISSLASTFPTLFLPSPCLFSTYHLCYLFSVPPPTSQSPIDNPPCDLHFCGSVSVLVFA